MDTRERREVREVLSISDFRTGLKIETEEGIFEILDFQHVKLGRGGAFVRAKVKNILTGAVTERTFRGGDKMERVTLETRQAQYLYNDGAKYYFMDLETFEQLELSAAQLGKAPKYLKETENVDILFCKDQVIGVELPTFVELQVIETEPGFRGDTVSGGSKPAKLETGAVVQVPLFVNAGDVIKIDTRTDEYIERVK